MPIESNRQHVDQGSDMPYRNRPPSSGDHYPTPAGYGVFTSDIPVGDLVDTLEQGGTVLYCRPDLCTPACIAELQRAYSIVSKSPSYGVTQMAVAAWSDMDQAVTAATWAWINGMEQPDVQPIVALYREHVDGGLEDAL